MFRIGWNQVINEICLKIISERGEVGRSRDKARTAAHSFLGPTEKYLEVHSANLPTFVPIRHFPFKKNFFKHPEKVVGTRVAGIAPVGPTKSRSSVPEPMWGRWG